VPSRHAAAAPSYEVVDFEPGKRLVLSGISEYHTETSQFLFMPDRTDPGMTVGGGWGGWRIR
jgi:hypothetical protein